MTDFFRLYHQLFQISAAALHGLVVEIKIWIYFSSKKSHIFINYFWISVTDRVSNRKEHIFVEYVRSDFHFITNFYFPKQHNKHEQQNQHFRFCQVSIVTAVSFAGATSVVPDAYIISIAAVSSLFIFP